MKKLLLPGSALLWGLQLAFLSPALALILVNLYGATTADLGWVLGIYNAGGFLAALLIPARADKTKDYLVPMLVCGGLTILLAGVLSAVTALPMATVALVVLGGPAGVGSTLLFAHLRHSGGRPSDVINARAIVSVAWVAGPPLATFIIGSLGTRAILLAVAAIAVLNIITTALLIRQRTATSTNADTDPQTTPQSSGPGETPVGLRMVVPVTFAFVLLQATNATAMTIMTLFVPQTLGLDVIWAGIALGVAAALEIPALLLCGRLSERFSALGLITTSCIAGIAYFSALMLVTDPIGLLAIQIFNAWSFAGIAGIGMTLFQDMIPRPGLSTGLYMNTRRLGAIVSGPIIAIGSMTILGQRGIFFACAALTLAGLALIALANRASKKIQKRTREDLTVS